jgi:hypothetical protein
MMVPSFAVVKALTLVLPTSPLLGLVNPGMVNVMGWPAENVPDVNDTVKPNHDPVPLRAAVPAAPVNGEVNETEALPEFARAMPEPQSVMMIFPLLGTVVAGVSVTYMITDVALRALLLRVMTGEFSPRSPM